VLAQPRKIAFYADIFYDSELSPAYWIPPTYLDVDAILLGGDIHYSPDHLARMLRSIRDSQNPATQIIVVPGNGEYVEQELTQARREYRAAVAAVPNAAFLDDDVIELAGGGLLIGSTLWSHVPARELGRYRQMLADQGLRGVDNIRLGDRFLTLEDTNELHHQARSFIERQLRALTPAERARTIVCTHFWPTLRPWTGPAGDLGERWYYTTGSDLDALIAACGPRRWLCGHAHTTHHVTIGTTRISSNPRAGGGPGNVNPDFAETYVVEL
jgi:hypothetical protein